MIKENIQEVVLIYDLNGVANSYKVTCIDNSICQVPLDINNTDYQDIQEWIADGNTVIDNGGGE
jgi:hypothetical protein